jgi:hypothetical protein
MRKHTRTIRCLAVAAGLVWTGSLAMGQTDDQYPQYMQYGPSLIAAPARAFAGRIRELATVRVPPPPVRVDTATPAAKPATGPELEVTASIRSRNNTVPVLAQPPATAAIPVATTKRSIKLRLGF